MLLRLIKQWFSPWLPALIQGIPLRELQPARASWGLNPEAKKLLRTVGPYTLSDPLRLAILHGLVREILKFSIAGDLVECGVYKGGTAAILGTAVAEDPSRRLWLYDVFEGMPAPGPRDPAEAQAETGLLAVGTHPLQTVLEKVGVPAERVTLRKGLFADTFRQPLPDRIALLHIDADWYDSVLSALRTFYPAVVDGGWIVLDDFAYWEGTRRAFYTFCREQGLEPLLERTGFTQAFWRKGQENTRQAIGRYVFGIYRPA